MHDWDKVDNMEILARYKDGSVSHQLWSGRIIEWEGEQCLLVVAKMIDDLKKTEAELAQYRNHLEVTCWTMQFKPCALNRRLLKTEERPMSHPYQ